MTKDPVRKRVVADLRGTKAPVWQRVVGGLCGLGIVISVKLMLGQNGVSGAAIEHWEMSIGMAIAAAAGVLWLMRR